MKPTNLLLTLISLLFIQALTAQTPDLLLQNFTTSHSIEKIYISHDKPYYLMGETIWCRVFLVDGRTHQAVDQQSIVYVDWIDPEGTVLQSYNLKTTNGVAQFDIPIAKIASVGKYVLRAYTLYQKNFDSAFIFQKEILINDFKIPRKKKEPVEAFSVQFFPEGGDLVAGMSSRVAFKAQDSKGNDILVSGIYSRIRRRRR